MLINYLELSKTISYALRHAPEYYNLELDNEGWVSLTDLLAALNEKHLNVTKENIIEMVAIADKKRHQILEGKIRAYYGHSTNEKIIKKLQTPPDILYHGTIAGSLSNILEKGLLPMNRQYVHLSINQEMANEVARRRKGERVILKINAQEAFLNGIPFYKEENDVWLAESISAKYISI
jgi:putative RNA 2'-phosphotransferase